MSGDRVVMGMDVASVRDRADMCLFDISDTPGVYRVPGHEDIVIIPMETTARDIERRMAELGIMVELKTSADTDRFIPKVPKEILRRDPKQPAWAAGNQAPRSARKSNRRR